MKTQRGRPAGWLLLGLGGLMLVGGTGCAATLLSFTGTEESALYLPTNRAEVVESLGQPDKTESFPDGSTEDTYQLRKKLVHPSSLPGHSSGSGDPGLAMELGMLWITLNVLAYGAPEVIAAGVVLAKSVHDGHRITFGYDSAGQIILRNLLNQPPAVRFAQVQRQLSQRLQDEVQNAAEPLAPCIDRYGIRLRRWAHRVEYPVLPETDEALQLPLQLAQDAEEGLLGREEVILWLKAPSAYNPLCLACPH